MVFDIFKLCSLFTCSIRTENKLFPIISEAGKVVVEVVECCDKITEVKLCLIQCFWCVAEHFCVG